VVEPFPASLHAALSALAEWIATERIPATIIGGIAVSVLGRPRLTQDIDALAIERPGGPPVLTWKDSLSRRASALAARVTWTGNTQP